MKKIIEAVSAAMVPIVLVGGVVLHWYLEGSRTWDRIRQAQSSSVAGMADFTPVRAVPVAEEEDWELIAPDGQGAIEWIRHPRGGGRQVYARHQTGRPSDPSGLTLNYTPSYKRMVAYYPAEGDAGQELLILKADPAEGEDPLICGHTWRSRAVEPGTDAAWPLSDGLVVGVYKDANTGAWMLWHLHVGHLSRWDRRDRAYEDWVVEIRISPWAKTSHPLGDVMYLDGPYRPRETPPAVLVLWDRNGTWFVDPNTGLTDYRPDEPTRGPSGGPLQ